MKFDEEKTLLAGTIKVGFTSAKIHLGGKGRGNEHNQTWNLKKKYPEEYANPDWRIVAPVRNPIDRWFSHHIWRLTFETKKGELEAFRRLGGVEGGLGAYYVPESLAASILHEKSGYWGDKEAMMTRWIYGKIPAADHDRMEIWKLEDRPDDWPRANESVGAPNIREVLPTLRDGVKVTAKLALRCQMDMERFGYTFGETPYQVGELVDSIASKACGEKCAKAKKDTADFFERVFL